MIMIKDKGKSVKGKNSRSTALEMVNSFSRTSLISGTDPRPMAFPSPTSANMTLHEDSEINSLKQRSSITESTSSFRLSSSANGLLPPPPSPYQQLTMAQPSPSPLAMSTQMNNGKKKRKVPPPPTKPSMNAPKPRPVPMMGQGIGLPKLQMFNDESDENNNGQPWSGGLPKRFNSTIETIEDDLKEYERQISSQVYTAENLQTINSSRNILNLTAHNSLQQVNEDVDEVEDNGPNEIELAEHVIQAQSQEKVGGANDSSVPPLNGNDAEKEETESAPPPNPVAIRNRIMVNAHDIIRTEKIRKKILKTEYPFPHFCKKCAWCMLIIWCIICCAAVIFYGAHFDLTYKVCASDEPTYSYAECYEKSHLQAYVADPDTNDTSTRRILQDEDDIIGEDCEFRDTLSDRVESQIIDYINDLATTGEIDLTGVPDDDAELLRNLGLSPLGNTLMTNTNGESENIFENIPGIYGDRNEDLWGAGITDSEKWIYTCLYTLLIGFIIWQTLWLYFIAVVYVCIPGISVFICTKTLCPCCFLYFKSRDAAQDARHDLMVRNMLRSHNLSSEFINEYNKIDEDFSYSSSSEEVDADVAVDLRSRKISKSKSKTQSRILKVNGSVADEMNHEDKYQALSQSKQKVIPGLQSTILVNAMIEERNRQSQITNDKDKHLIRSRYNGRRVGVLSEDVNVVSDDNELEEEEKSEVLSDSEWNDRMARMNLEKIRKRRQSKNKSKMGYKEFICDDDDLGIDGKQFIDDLENNNLNLERDRFVD